MNKASAFPGILRNDCNTVNNASCLTTILPNSRVAVGGWKKSLVLLIHIWDEHRNCDGLTQQNTQNSLYGPPCHVPPADAVYMTICCGVESNNQQVVSYWDFHSCTSWSMLRGGGFIGHITYNLCAVCNMTHCLDKVTSEVQIVMVSCEWSEIHS